MNNTRLALKWLAASLAMGCGGEAGHEAEITSEEGVQDVAGTPSPDVEVQSTAVSVIDVAERQQLKFISLPGTAAIFVSEVSNRKDGVSALELVETELALEGEFTAKDVFLALTTKGTEIPEALAALSAVDREQGWALPLLQDALTADVGYSNSTPACSNSSFTATTYGGIIDHNATWLDRHPWQEYSQYVGYWSGTQFYTPRVSASLERHNIRQYRGKLCYEQIDCAVGQSCHTAVQGYLQSPTYLAPMISFQYRRPGESSWSFADSEYVARGDTESMNWAFYGWQGEEWDWRMQTTRGQSQDWFDYMRSYYE